MGRITTPKYRVEARFADNTGTTCAWRVRDNYGRGKGNPTAENLAKWVGALECSTLPGGCNSHLDPIVVFSAKIIEQRTGHVMATYRGPSFVVLEV
jgi:hypothetical protein